jgi:hypothetical protein
MLQQTDASFCGNAPGQTKKKKKGAQKKSAEKLVGLRGFLSLFFSNCP